MPGKQRGWGDDEAGPALLGQQVCRGGKQQPVAAAQLGAADLALQDLNLLAKDEDLDLAVTLIACGRQTKNGAQHHVEE